VWETAKVGYKPHACVTSIHAALDAFAHILREQDLSPDDVASVRIGMSAMTYTHCAWEYKAQGVTAAQMNLFYGIAVIAFDGMAFVAQYADNRLADPRILDFITRIQARIDPEIEALGPAFRHAARVSVTTRDGQTYAHEILNRRGSPENPLSHADVVYKFRNVVGSCLSRSDIDRVIALIDRLETLDDTAALRALLAAPRP
jgi:2-methylcitrate dehydratase PrpD